MVDKNNYLDFKNQDEKAKNKPDESCSHEWYGYYGINLDKNFLHCYKCNSYKEN